MALVVLAVFGLIMLEMALALLGVSLLGGRPFSVRGEAWIIALLTTGSILYTVHKYDMGPLPLMVGLAVLAIYLWFYVRSHGDPWALSAFDPSRRGGDVMLLEEDEDILLAERLTRRVRARSARARSRAVIGEQPSSATRRAVTGPGARASSGRAASADAP